MSEALPEPWLRGPIAGVDPLLAPALHALGQAEEDLQRSSGGLRDEEVWMRPYGLASLGFHLRHIAGSLDRLSTYLAGGQLSAAQLAFLAAEAEPGATLEELLDGASREIRAASEAIRGLDLDSLRNYRGVGRKKLPTTVIGLAVHLAEHTQRHVGQAITVCQLLKALRAVE